MARVIQTLRGEPPPRTLQGYLQTDLARERARRGLPVVDLEHFTGQGGGPASADVVRQVKAFTRQVQREGSPKADRDALVRSFVQKTGPRAGQKYTVKRGASGVPIRVYASGDTALAGSAFKGQSGPNRQLLAGRARRKATRGLGAWGPSFME